MKYFKKIEGERIYLSPLNVEDVEKYVEWFTDYTTTDGMGSTATIYNIENEREWMESTLKEGRYIFAIVNKENDELIGNCGFDNINHRNRKGTIGIFIGNEKHRNKGYGTEVIKLLLDFGFNYLNLNNINLFVFSFNERAIECYKKAGFKECRKKKRIIFFKWKIL